MADQSANPNFAHLTFQMKVTPVAAGGTGIVTFENQTIYDISYELWGFNFSTNVNEKGTSFGQFTLEIDSNTYFAVNPTTGGLGVPSRNYDMASANQPAPNNFHAIDCETLIRKDPMAMAAAKMIEWMELQKGGTPDYAKQCSDEYLKMFPDETIIVPRPIMLIKSLINFKYTDDGTSGVTGQGDFYFLNLNLYVKINRKIN